MSDHYKELLKLFRQAARRHDTYTVFRDFCEMAAISLSNAVDLRQRDQREARYLTLARTHQDTLDLFPRMLGHLTLAHEDETADHLGRAFHELELQNRWAGQFFTPYPVCLMMAKMQIADGVRDIIRTRGFIRANEPACGAGAMMIALCHALKDEGINYQQHLHVVAQDIDPRSVHMTYLQLALLHCPAVVIQGNSLALEEQDRWFTPAHILGFWNARLATDQRITHAAPHAEAAPEPPPPPPAPDPQSPLTDLFGDAATPSTPQPRRSPSPRPRSTPTPSTQFTLF